MPSLVGVDMMMRRVVNEATKKCVEKNCGGSELISTDYKSTIRRKIHHTMCDDSKGIMS